MHRTIWYSQEQVRTFDWASLEHDILQGLGYGMGDLLGQTTTVVSGLAATPTSPATLTVNVGAGRVCQLSATDGVSVGSIAADSTLIMQQGIASAQALTLSTASLTSGKSQWVLIQAQFSQVDQVRSGDPNGGIPPFYNSANPTSPLNGQGGLGVASPTQRASQCVLQAISGSVANSGSEVPPNPTTGWVPLYLIDLTYGQTQITSGQILTAGPSVGLNVPSNYPQAPFLAGLLSSHHGGVLGQAPKINLATEVSGVLPTANGGYPRVFCTSAVNFYVNASTGNDSNNGLSSGTAFRTIQAAWNAAANNYDFAGQNVTFNLTGAFTAGVFMSAPLVGQSSTNVVLFTGASGCSVTTTNSHCFYSFGAKVSVAGSITMSASGSFGGTAASCIVCASGGNVAVTGGGGLTFGSAAGYHILSNSGALIGIAGAYTVSGGAAAHFFASGGQILTGATSPSISLTGVPNFTTAFAWATFSGLLGVTNLTFTGTATGIRYLGASFSNISTGSSGSATYFPGSSAGSVTNALYS